MSLYVMCMALFAIGVYCVVVKRNIVKKIVGFGIIEYAINLFFILLGYRKGGEAPIIDVTMRPSTTVFVDSLPQALILTSIVIGLGVTALMVALAVRLYEKYGTFDMDEIRKLRG
jgi:multicomponent Na+:H+ antiporter subunit C